MFRLSVITDEISQDFEHALDVAVELGLGGVELRSLWDKNIVDLDAEELARVERYIAARGLVVICVAGPFLKCDLVPRAHSERRDTFSHADTGVEEQVGILDHTMELCGRFGTKLVRTFSFWRLPDPALAYPAVTRRLADYVAQAERGGCVLALENEHACNLGTAAESARLLNDIPSPALGLAWDPGNAINLGERPYPDGYDLVKDRIIHVHLKDNRMPRADRRLGEYCAIGSGDIDYVGQFRALAADSYSGWLSLETHYKIGGSGEAATRECHAGLLRTLAKAGL